MKNRNANSLPGGRGGVDPKTASEILQRTPQVGGGGDEIIHTHSGTIISRRKQRGVVSFVTPFKLYGRVGATTEYKVSETASTIADGTNGASIAIATFDTWATVGTGEKYVVAESTVSTDLTTSTFTIKTSASADEVIVDGSGNQTFLRLIIGTVEVVGDVLVVKQATWTPQRLSFGFLNGSLVRILESAPATL